MSHAGETGRGFVATDKVIVFNGGDRRQGIANDYNAETVIERGAGYVRIGTLRSEWSGQSSKQQDTGEKTSESVASRDILKLTVRSCSRESLKHSPAPRNRTCMKAAFLIGRLVFGGFFLYNGINHIKQHKNLAQYAGLKNVPMPDQAVTASTVLLLLGGASILLGTKPKIGTAAVIAFLAGGLTDDPRFLDPERSQASGKAR